MSRILWSNVLVPDDDREEQAYSNEYYGDSINIQRTKRLPIEEKSASLPDRKVYRSMSRTGVLLSLVCLDGQSFVKPLVDRSPFSVGMYCALENGPVDLQSAKKMHCVSRDDFPEEYRKHHNPKMYLKLLPNLAAAQLGIFLGIMGPLNVYNNSTHGSIHALQQAEMDLEENKIDAALVCSAFSFENPLTVERVNRQNLHDRTLCEGAGALLLTSDGRFSNWKNLDYEDTESYFGISHQIIIQTLSKGGINVY